MGSFNETCMVSGLPIGYGDDVRVLVIKKSGTKDTGCLVYPSDMWSPVSMPIRAKYDDYGRAVLAPEHETMAEFAIGLLNTVLEPVEQGENRYHDIAVTSIESWTHLFDVCHEGRLRFKNTYPASTWAPATRVMIREDVWQAMLGHKFKQEWYQDSPMTLESLSKNALDFFGSFVNVQDQSTNAFFLARIMAENPEDGPGFPNHFYTEGYSSIIKRVIFDRIEEKLYTNEWDLEHPVFKHICQAFVELAFVQRQFHYIGKMWTPMMTSGQEMQWEECMEFHQKMAKVAAPFVRENIKQRRYEEMAEKRERAKEMKKKFAAKNKKK